MQNYLGFCNGILTLDKSIRYVGLADHLGSLISMAYRNGLVPLATSEETTKYTERAIHHLGALGGSQTGVGKLQYVVGRYENLIRATIPITSDNYDKFYLMASLEINSNPILVIENKILPHIQKNRFPLE